MVDAPNLDEKYLYLDSGRKSLYTLGFLSTVIVTVGNLFFVYYNPVFWAYLLFVGLTTLYMAMTYWVGFFGRDFDFNLHKKLVAKWLDKSETASVDIYLPVCNEPISVILNTWGHVKQLASGHDNISVYVLDDGKCDKLKQAAENLKFSYIRRETNELKKAGNLRNAFKQTSGEFILILDADFAPSPGMLAEMLPYMFENPMCGIVQSPQFFTVSDHETWIGRGASAVQELFYRLIQVSRDTFNGAICVGSNALYRRTALEPHGGTAAIGYSEDARTGFRLKCDGYRLNYLPINLAKGLCPDDLKSFFVQQMRWSMGSISLFFSREFWVNNLSTMQIICYLTGIFYYISTGLSVLFMPLPSLLMLIFYPEKIFWFNLLFSIPSLLFGYLFMAFWLKAPFSLDIQRSRIVSYFAHAYALRDFFFNSFEAWIPTGDKNTKSSRFDSFRKVFYWVYIGPQYLALALIGLRISQGFHYSNFILLIAFTAFNLFLAWPIIKCIKKY